MRSSRPADGTGLGWRILQLLRIYSCHHVSIGLEAEAAIERLRGFVGDEQHAPHRKPAEELRDDTGADPAALVGGVYGNIIERCVILPVAQGPASTDQLSVRGGKACECSQLTLRSTTVHELRSHTPDAVVSEERTWAAFEC